MAIGKVAQLAGVSIATVSRVVNGHADVSVQTREAVRRVMREQGYQAGPCGRPALGGPGLIGVTIRPALGPGGPGSCAPAQARCRRMDSST